MASRGGSRNIFAERRSSRCGAGDPREGVFGRPERGRDRAAPSPAGWGRRSDGSGYPWANRSKKASPSVRRETGRSGSNTSKGSTGRGDVTRRTVVHPGGATRTGPPGRCRLRGVVPAAGLEPARPKPRDFKSRASTCSAKRAADREPRAIPGRTRPETCAGASCSGGCRAVRGFRRIGRGSGNGRARQRETVKAVRCRSAEQEFNSTLKRPKETERPFAPPRTRR